MKKKKQSDSFESNRDVDFFVPKELRYGLGYRLGNALIGINSALSSVRRAFYTFVILVSIASIALSCSIPVFRYALEHWMPEPFIVHIISSSKLDEGQIKLIKELEELGKNANIRLKVSDGQNATPDEFKAVIQLYAKRDSAWLVVESSKKMGGSPQVIWDAPFTKKTVEKLLISPVRKRVCQGLVGRDSVSWVFLDSGDPAVDDAKFAKLESELRRLEKTIKLPEIEAADLKDLSKNPDELKIHFAAHRISRTDSSEAAFVSMLLSTESDLREEYDKGSPMAFPVFGRGRVLYALLGEGIATSTIEEASRFLAGACQCTVKADNPGVDMLVAFDWDEHIQITEPKKADDLPLTGLGAFANQRQAVASVSSQKPENEGFAAVTIDKNFQTHSESVNNESVQSVVPVESVADQGQTTTSTDTPVHGVNSKTELITNQSFTFYTLAALAAIVGSITMGWVFLFSPKT